MCGPSGCCQADHGSCCELARLSVSTYMPLFSKGGERKEEKERRETGDGRRGVTTEGWSERIPRRAQNMSAGGTASPARFTDFQLLKTRLAFSPPPHLCPPPPPHPLSLALEWFKRRDNLWRNSKRQESRDYPKRKMVDDGIFKGLPEMIAWVFCFGV